LKIAEKVAQMNVTLPINPRDAEHPVDALFLNRHSPRAFGDATVSEAQMLTLLEAARWAPSANNFQPWRFAWGLRGDAGFAAMVDTMVPFNRAWAEKAAAVVAIASKTGVAKDEGVVPNPSHGFDAGAAWVSLALQAEMLGLSAHAMGGFDKAAAAAALGLPDGHEIHVLVAIGKKGDPAHLPEALRPREIPNPRQPLAELAARGQFPA
jgi:nitroreductase